MKSENDNNSELTLQICNNDTVLIDCEANEIESENFSPHSHCTATGELIKNGGMEEFKCGVPKGWHASNPCQVTRVTAPGRVHSGDSCVGLGNCVSLEQKIMCEIHHGCYFRFSFFAQDEGTNGSITATVTFLRGCEEIPGGEIVIRAQDIPNTPRQFGYY